MDDRLLQIYHRLPPSARSLAASLRGYYLRSWRYGAGTERLIAEALERERWPRERLLAWQQERLAAVLHRAATRVPFYRQMWAERRRSGDKASWELLENWPLLEKESLRQNAQAFVADDCDARRMYHEHTSGTSGKSLDLWITRGTLKHWYALNEARWRRWYGVASNDRWAILGGQLVAPVKQRQPPFWVWNQAINQLYLSSYHLAPDLISHYLDALERYRITFLLGYTSALHALAQGAIELKRTLPMKVVITNAEPVFDYQRAAISAAFQCPVRETYGMAEYVAAASECEFGQLHLWPEAGLVEVFNDGQAARDGEPGELICTGLLNADMPLIRYRLGDRGRLTPKSAGPCACGRTLPRLAQVEGRVDDVLYTADGRRIGRLDPIFKAQLPVREAQIIQERLNLVRVRYIPAPGFKPEDGRAIIERLQARMGRVDVVLEELNEIPRTSSGKFRAVICQLPPEQIKALQTKSEIRDSRFEI